MFFQRIDTGCIVMALTACLLWGIPANHGHAAQLPAQQRELVRKGVHLLYNLDYGKALTCFDQLRSKHPHHPLPWFFRAMVFWTRMVQLDQSPGVRRAFLNNLERCEQQARKMLLIDPTWSGGYFYQAAARGFRARYHIMLRDMTRAVTEGWEGYKLMLQSFRQDKSNPDHYLGLGLFNYYAGSMDGAVRNLAAALGMKGDMHKGLRQIAFAAKNGRYAALEAQVFQVDIYTYQMGKPARALPIVENLIKKFPKNPRFRVDRIENLINQGQATRALRYSKKLEAAVLGGDVDKRWLFRIYAQRGKLYLSCSRFPDALRVLNRALKQSCKLPRDSLSWLYLRRGWILDRYGYRKQAIAQYRQVLKITPFGDVAARARKAIDHGGPYHK